MPIRRLKIGYFILEGSNSFASVYYAYYLYFFMEKAFGFGNKANLTLAACYGGIYTVAAWLGGRVSQRIGYLSALKLGFATMAGGLIIGSQVSSATAQIGVMALIVIGMCLTWPSLEALVSDGEGPATLPRMIGIYNVVWAGTGALSYFVGGAMLDRLGLKSMFYVPLAIELAQLAFCFWLQAKVHAAEVRTSQADSNQLVATPLLPDLNPRPIAKARAFLRMAWLANPFAYIAINTLIAVMPALSARLGLSTTLAGFCGSVWCFSRLGAFFLLWFWEGWHYRFRWMMVAYVGLLATFAAILAAPNLAALVAAQLVFGAAVGLIYYSSLFYSMDTSEAKGEHGGIHEAAIGLGNFAGPAMGAASLHFLPDYANSGVLAVTGLLAAGLAGLVAIRKWG